MPWWVVGLRLMGMGWYIAFCIVGGLAGGLYLGKLFIGAESDSNIPAFFAIFGVVLGSIVAFWGVYKMILPVLYGSNQQSPQQTPRKGRRG